MQGQYLIFLHQQIFLSTHYSFITGRCMKRHSYQRLYVVILVLLLPAMANIYLSSQGSKGVHPQWRSRRLLVSQESSDSSPLIDVHDSKFMIGYVFGCISSVIYFFAVPSQIIKNVRVYRYLSYYIRLLLWHNCACHKIQVTLIKNQYCSI